MAPLITFQAENVKSGHLPRSEKKYQLEGIFLVFEELSQIIETKINTYAGKISEEDTLCYNKMKLLIAGIENELQKIIEGIEQSNTLQQQIDKDANSLLSRRGIPSRNKKNTNSSNDPFEEKLLKVEAETSETLKLANQITNSLQHLDSTSEFLEERQIFCHGAVMRIANNYQIANYNSYDKIIETIEEVKKSLSKRRPKKAQRGGK